MCKGCHVVCVKAEIRSLHALCRAAHRLGGEVKFGQTTFRWFGAWVGDYDEADAAHRHGIKPENYGQCDHALHFPNANYEVGVLRQGDSYTLLLDFWDTRLAQILGGNGAPKLIQAYAVEAAREQAHLLCLPVAENVLDDGSIQLRIQVNE